MNHLRRIWSLVTRQQPQQPAETLREGEDVMPDEAGDHDALEPTKPRYCLDCDQWHNAFICPCCGARTFSDEKGAA